MWFYEIPEVGRWPGFCSSTALGKYLLTHYLSFQQRMTPSMRGKTVSIMKLECLCRARAKSVATPRRTVQDENEPRIMREATRAGGWDSCGHPKNLHCSARSESSPK